MPQPPIVIVIATGGKARLLERTLETIAVANRPSGLHRVIVAENGPKYEAESVAERFSGRLPIAYRYNEQPNKSLALNEAVASVPPDSLIVFFDDDVRVHENALVAYANAASNVTGGVYWAGRCQVDYEEEPPSWLKSYLPPSAAGWSLGNTPRPLKLPAALGFNWAAFAADILRVGGFDTTIGPGTAVAVGDETELQRRLLAAGVASYYAPDAVVWHHVPRNRCTPEWVLGRAAQNGFAQGLSDAIQAARRAAGARKPRPIWIRRTGAQLRAWRYRVANAFLPQLLAPETRFHNRYWQAWYAGIHRGMRHHRKRRA